MGILKLALALLTKAILIGFSRQFALPEGLSLTRTYKHHQRMKVFVSDLFADPLNPKLGHAMELEKYSCDPETPKSEHSSFLQRLLKDEYHNSSYSINFGMDEFCKTLCSKEMVRDVQHIEPMYMKMYIDNFPVSLSRNFTKTIFEQEKVSSRFSIPTMLKTQSGSVHGTKNSIMVFNHYRFIIHTVAVDPLQKEGPNGAKNTSATQRLAISDVEVIPMSIQHMQTEYKTTSKCTYGNDIMSRQNTMLIKEIWSPEEEVIRTLLKFTYDVVFIPKDALTYTTSFDDMRKTSTVLEANVLIGCAVIIILLGVVTFIIRCNLKRVADSEEEELTLVNAGTGRSEHRRQADPKIPHPSLHLKAIKNDVFRPPKFPRIYSLLVGFGIQFSFTLIGTCLFLFIFFQSQTHRGKVMGMLLIFYLCSGTLLGYFSSRIYMTINGVHWLSIAMITSLIIPGVFFVAFYSINCFLWMENSYYSISFTELLWLIFLWLGVFVPQVFIGSYLGFSSKKLQAPCSVNLVARGVEEVPFFLQTHMVGIFGGLLPFTVFYFTAYLVFYGIWINSSYSIISVPLLFLSVQIYLVTCSLVGIITTYVNLFYENYNWWWSSFFSAAGTGLWIFTATLVVSLSLLKTLEELAIFVLLNFALSSLIAIMSGSVATLSSYFFVRYLYQQLRLK